MLTTLQLPDSALTAGQSSMFLPNTVAREFRKLIHSTTETREMVHYTITKREGKDYQGCLAACAR